MPIDKAKLLFLPVEIAQKPLPGVSHHMSKCWWAVHPEKGIILYKRTAKSVYCVPQFNIDEYAATTMMETLFPFAEIKQIDHVYLRYSESNGYVVPLGANPA